MKSSVVMKPNHTIVSFYCVNKDLSDLKNIIVFNWSCNEVEFHYISYTETGRRNTDGECIGTWHIKPKQLEN